jgi:energy-coupling factor transporter ATP-binding protein EcfA2/energy-coupling factor transporter transmembrane protein EcfT
MVGMPKPSSSAPIVRATEVRVTHPGAPHPAPDGATLDLHLGEVTLLLGPSGAGKSTLALTLDGLVPLQSDAELTGEVVVAGRRTVDATVAELARTVAMVFQDADAQLVTATVFDEVCFGVENLCQSRAEVLARAERALRRVGLWERRLDDPADLSGGGRQRLAIAGALALGSPVIVLDEPTANLDPRGVVDVYRLIGELARERTHAILLVEHDLDDAMDVVDRVVVLDRRGRVRLDGPARCTLVDHADEVAALGVWLPASLRAGRLLGLDPLPLTPAELRRALTGLRPVPVGDGGDAGAREAGAAENVVAAGRGATDGACDTAGSEVSTPAEGPDVTVVAASRRPTSPAPARSDAGFAARIRHLTVHAPGCGGRVLLDDVSLDVPRGAFLAVVGRNGAGKSTLLHRLAGVVAPPPGVVAVRDAAGAWVDPARVSSRRLAAAVGFVFQNPEHQFITESVAEEIAHGLRLQGRPDEEIAARVDALLDRLDLAELRDTHPYLLSGGQKRRLSVGTALVTGAPLLCLDEPTYGQDQARAQELVALLERLVAEGTTVVIVTHDMQLVAESATHVAVVDDGRVVACGPAADVLAGPAPRAAGLLPPPFARAVEELPGWAGVARLGQLRGMRLERVPEGGSAEVSGRGSAAADPSEAAHGPDPSRRSEHGRRATPRPSRVSVFDPLVPASRRPRRAPLARLNPVAKLLAVLPLLVVVIALPSMGAVAGVGALALAVVVAGSGAGWRRLSAIVAGILVGTLVFSVSVGVWVDPGRVTDHRPLFTIDGWTFTVGAWLSGLEVTLRVAALAALGLVPGLTATGPDTIRALVARAHVPYRLGYTTLAAYRFVPRFGHELEQIRRAHRVRGVSAGRGPLAALRRGLGYALPLLAGGLRHAERVALSMDARAFGAAPTRTERYDIPWRARDGWFVALFWLAAAAAAIWGGMLWPAAA